ncbi:MAG: potassium transporter TrkG [Clostridia bacterium]|nr:potassium transporter TrkG [Clostridia bacterium]
MKKKLFQSPYAIIFVGFVGVIAVGALLLWMPISTLVGVRLRFTDAFFMSTSAVCVTGLSPVAALSSTLSVFGRVVVALLAQIGGLGIATLAIYMFTILGVKINLNEKTLIKEALNQKSSRGLIKLVKKIMMITLCCEALGTILYFISFIREFPFIKALGYAAFHSITAFNNCGFDIIGPSSFAPYAGDVFFNIITMLLITLGGIGYIVLIDLFEFNKKRRLQLHTQIVLYMYLILNVGGMLLIKLAQGGNTTWLQSLFTAVSARTAGFATIDFNSFEPGSLIVVMILMVVGAAPVSTGGGIKVTAVFAIAKSVVSYARGNKPMSKSRRISDSSIFRAYILLAFAVFALLAFSLILSLIEGNKFTLTQLFFECTSAFGTVGYSMGVTYKLSIAGKWVLVPLMLLGRLGPLSFMALFTKRQLAKNQSLVKYIEQDLIIG